MCDELHRAIEYCALFFLMIDAGLNSMLGKFNAVDMIKRPM